MESGELCLLASLIGSSGDIVFPKLDEARDMIGFDQVALDLLQALGMEPIICSSEEEARARMGEIRKGGSAGVREWPVYFFESDTSGEKAFEEFYTADETLDMDKFVNLGVIKNARRRPLAEIDGICAELERLFAREAMTKAEVVEVLKNYLPNFAHIETGKGLDQRM